MRPFIELWQHEAFTTNVFSVQILQTARPFVRDRDTANFCETFGWIMKVQNVQRHPIIFTVEKLPQASGLCSTQDMRRTPGLSLLVKEPIRHLFICLIHYKDGASKRAWCYKTIFGCDKVTHIANLDTYTTEEML